MTPSATTAPLSAGARTASARLGLRLATVGVLCLGVAWVGGSRSGHTEVPAVAASSLAAPSEANGGTSVYASVYEPGQSSGWHRHAGTHVVVVVSGTLAVYDDGCVLRTYAAGDAYIGGSNPHLASNAGEEPVHMVVTNISDAGTPAGDLTVPVLAPGGCAPSSTSNSSEP